MNRTRLMAAVAAASTAAALFLAQGPANASEITEFAVPTQSVVSRAAVKSETRAANDAGRLHFDEYGSVERAPQASMRSREQVRMEARTAARAGARSSGNAYYVGGM